MPRSVFGSLLEGDIFKWAHIIISQGWTLASGMIITWVMEKPWMCNRHSWGDMCPLWPPIAQPHKTKLQYEIVVHVNKETSIGIVSLRLLLPLYVCARCCGLYIQVHIKLWIWWVEMYVHVGFHSPLSGVRCHPRLWIRSRALKYWSSPIRPCNYKMTWPHLLFLSACASYIECNRSKEERERKNYPCIWAYFSFIQHKSPKVVCNSDVTFL